MNNGLLIEKCKAYTFTRKTVGLLAVQTFDSQCSTMRISYKRKNVREAGSSLIIVAKNINEELSEGKKDNRDIRLE